MAGDTQAAGGAAPSGSKAMTIVGWIVGGLPALFLVMVGGMNLSKPEFVVKSTTELGYSENVIVPLGAALLAGALLYLVPQTAVLGAIVLTGYLGGAVNVHVRNGDGWFQILFPVLFAALLWLGLVLRDARLRSVLPVRR
jgi:hypothetical protein